MTIKSLAAIALAAYVLLCCYFLPLFADPTHVCDQAASADWASGNQCSKFRSCCQRECTDRDRSLQKADCDDRFYSVSDKKCECGELGKAGEVSNSIIQQRCERQANGKFFDGEKCSEFRKCCRDSCIAQKRSIEEDSCDNSFYSSRPKKCACGRRSHHHHHHRGGEGDDYYEQNRHRETERGADYRIQQSNGVTQEDCESRARAKTFSSEKCTEFRECCRETCHRQGKIIVENDCDSSFYDTGARKCECGGRKMRRGNDREHQHNQSSDSLSRQCRHTVEARDTPAREMCSDFRRCCDRECENTGRSACDRFNFEGAKCNCR